MTGPFLFHYRFGDRRRITQTARGRAIPSGVVALFVRLSVLSVVVGGGLWLFCLNQEDRATLTGLVLRRGAKTTAVAM